jgi:hypothetical protein
MLKEKYYLYGLKVGELYYNTLHGLGVITKLFQEPEVRLNGDKLIGEIQYFRMKTRNLTFTNNTRLTLATDTEILDYLNEVNLNLTDGAMVSFDPEYVSIIDSYGQVMLTRTAALKLKEILNRELV